MAKERMSESSVYFASRTLKKATGAATLLVDVANHNMFLKLCHSIHEKNMVKNINLTKYFQLH